MYPQLLASQLASLGIEESCVNLETELFLVYLGPSLAIWRLVLSLTWAPVLHPLEALVDAMAEHVRDVNDAPELSLVEISMLRMLRECSES